MKKILFLLLFLQVNVVFGQVIPSKNFRKYMVYIPDLYDDEYYNTTNIKKVKRIEVVKDETEISTGYFNKDGLVEKIDIKDNSTLARITIRYDKLQQLESEKIEIALDDSNMADECQYFRFKNPKNGIDNLVCFQIYQKNIIGIYAERINQNIREDINITVNTKHLKLSIADTTQIKEWIESEEEALENYQMGNFTRYGITKYQYEKEKLISYDFNMNFEGEKKLNFKRELKYITDKSGYVYQDGKIINIFFIESNGNFYEPVYAQTKVKVNIQYKLDNYGNWTTKMIPFIDKNDKIYWRKIKRKIEYYD